MATTITSADQLLNDGGGEDKTISDEDQDSNVITSAEQLLGEDTGPRPLQGEDLQKEVGDDFPTFDPDSGVLTNKLKAAAAATVGAGEVGINMLTEGVALGGGAIFTGFTSLFHDADPNKTGTEEFAASFDNLMADMHEFEVPGLDIPAFKARSIGGKTAEFVVQDWFHSLRNYSAMAGEGKFQFDEALGLEPEHRAARATAIQMGPEAALMALPFLPRAISGFKKMREVPEPEIRAEVQRRLQQEGAGGEVFRAKDWDRVYNQVKEDIRLKEQERAKVESIEREGAFEDFVAKDQPLTIRDWKATVREQIPEVKDSTSGELWNFMQRELQQTKERPTGLEEPLIDQLGTELGATPKGRTPMSRSLEQAERNVPYVPEPLPYRAFREIHNKKVRTGEPVKEATVQKRYRDYIKNYFPEIKLDKSLMNKMARFVGDKDLAKVSPLNDALMRYLKVREMVELHKREIAEGRYPNVEGVSLEHATLTPRVKQNLKLGDVKRGQRGAIDIQEIAEGIAKTAKTFDEFRAKLRGRLQGVQPSQLPPQAGPIIFPRVDQPTAFDPVLRQIFKDVKQGKKTQTKLLGQVKTREEVTQEALQAQYRRWAERDREINERLKENLPEVTEEPTRGPRGIVGGTDYPGLNLGGKGPMGRQRGAVGDLGGGGKKDINPQNVKEAASRAERVKDYGEQILEAAKTAKENPIKRIPNSDKQLVEAPDTNMGVYVSSQNYQSVPRFTQELFGGQSLSALRLNEHLSPTQRQLNDMFFRPEKHRMDINEGTVFRPNRQPIKGSGEVQESFHQSRMLNTGHFMSRLNDAFFDAIPEYFPNIRNFLPALLGGTAGRRVPKGINEEVVRALNTDYVPKNPKAQKLVQNTRQILNDFFDYVRREAPELKTEYRENYYPRNYLWQKIKKDHVGGKVKNRIVPPKHEFQAMLERNGFKTDEALKLIDDMVINEGRIYSRVENPYTAQQLFKSISEGDPLPAKSTALEYQRKLGDIPFEELEPWLDTNVYRTLQHAIEDGVKRVEYVKRFGKNNEKLVQYMTKIAQERMNTEKPLSAFEIKRMVDLSEAIQGIHYADMNKFWKNLQKGSVTLTNAAMLQFATLSSIPEMFYVMHLGGPKAYTKGLGLLGKQLLGNFGRQIKKDFMRLSKTDQELMLDAINKSGDIAAMERMNAMWAGDLTFFNDVIFRTNLLYYWTRFGNQLAANTYSYMIKDRLGKLAKSEKKQQKLSQEEINFLEHYLGRGGIEEGIRWAKDGFPTDDPFIRTFNKGALSFTEEAILVPNPMTAPMWHSNPNLMLLRHLKSFPTLIGNQVLKRWYYDLHESFRDLNVKSASKNTASVMGTSIGVLAMAHLSNILQDAWKYGGDNPIYEKQFEEDWTKATTRAIERSGGMGQANLIFDSLFHSYGQHFTVPLMGPDVSKFVAITGALQSSLENRNARPISRELSKLFSPIASWFEGKPFVGLKKEYQEEMTEHIQEWLESTGVFERKTRGGTRPNQPNR